MKPFIPLREQQYDPERAEDFSIQSAPLDPLESDPKPKRANKIHRAEQNTRDIPVTFNALSRCFKFRQ